MPASSAPSFSLATARMARPVSVAAHHQPQHQRHGEYRDESDQARQGQEDKAQIDAVEGIRQIDSARVGAEREQQRVLNDHRKPQRHQQHVAIIAVRGRTDDEALQRIADAKKGRRQQEDGEIRIDAERPIGEVGSKHGSGEQRAVGEIDDVKHAVDQRQAERDQRIDRAGQQTVDDGGSQDGRRQHGLTLLR